MTNNHIQAIKALLGEHEFFDDEQITVALAPSRELLFTEVARKALAMDCHIALLSQPMIWRGESLRMGDFFCFFYDYAIPKYGSPSEPLEDPIECIFNAVLDWYEKTGGDQCKE